MSWKFKSLLILFLTLLSVHVLLPTFLGLKEKREALKTANQPEPWYYALLPDKELNLGLDLRGGLYLELSVDVQEAARHQLTQLAADIERFVIRDKFPGADATVLPDRIIRIDLPQDKHEEFLNSLGENFDGKILSRINREIELFYDIKSDPIQARKAVIEALKGVTQSDVLVTEDGKRLAVPFASDADKPRIQEALARQDLSAHLAPTQGTSALYFKVSDAYFARLHTDTLEQAANAVRNRIDRFGVVEANVSKLGNDRLAIELPGIKNPDQIIDIIHRTGKLEFRLVDTSMPQAELESLISGKLSALDITTPYEKSSLTKLNQALKTDLPPATSIAYELVRDPGTKQVERAIPYLLSTDVTVTGDMLDNAKVESQNNQPYVSMSFNKSGTKSFGELTSANIGKSLAIVLDGVVMSAPRINSAITGGQAQIELGFNSYETLQREASDLVLILREGALPASLTIETKNLIGPSLGQDSINSGLKSLFIAALVIVVFMLVYYRTGGLIANLALIINVLFIFAILCAFQASLSLPGIAGIVLTLGMAVDANVLIFERMREEKFYGKSVPTIVETGYKHAMSAIVDGNITTFISGLVLFEFGTGPIKGFATTLMIGIVTTMFSAIFVTRTMYDFLVDAVKIKKLSV